MLESDPNVGVRPFASTLRICSFQKELHNEKVKAGPVQTALDKGFTKNKMP